jgi:sugar lactone lactonase YvrE
MLSLRFAGSPSPCGSRSRFGSVSRLAGSVGIVALLGTVACSSDDDEPTGTVALADSGELRELTNEIGIPTTVAVADGVAWVVESQFDRYAPFSGPNAGPAAPFRLVGVQLDSTGYSEIALPADFFPEGITATPRGRLYVGSVRTGAIYTVAAGSDAAEPFSTDLAPAVVGLTISNDAETLWICNTDTSATPPTALVIGMGVTDRAILGTHELPPSPAGAFCNDLVMSPDGALWVTESFGGRIFRIAPGNVYEENSAEVWLQADELAPPAPGQFGVNGITLLGGRLYVVVTDPGTLFAIDASLDDPSGSDLKQIDLGSSLVRPDGITRIPGIDTDLLIVENGLGVDGGKKLLRVRLNRL